MNKNNFNIYNNLPIYISNLTLLSSIIIGYIPLLITILYFIRKGEK